MKSNRWGLCGGARWLSKAWISCYVCIYSRFLISCSGVSEICWWGFRASHSSRGRMSWCHTCRVLTAWQFPTWLSAGCWQVSGSTRVWREWCPLKYPCLDVWGQTCGWWSVSWKEAQTGQHTPWHPHCLIQLLCRWQRSSGIGFLQGRWNGLLIMD